MMPNNRSILCTLLLLTLSSAAGICRAEESEPFFEKDFARAPARDAHRDNTLPSATTPTAAATTAEPVAVNTRTKQESIQDLVSAARDRAAGRTGQASAKTPSAKSQQMTVAVVGAVLNSNPPEEMAKLLDNMLNVLEKSKLLISTIYLVGQRKDISGVLKYRVAKLSGRMLFVDELPKKYQAITSAPAWILTSLDQEIIIEGAGPLSENLQSDGTIIARAQPLPSAAPTPAAPR